MTTLNSKLLRENEEDLLKKIIQYKSNNTWRNSIDSLQKDKFLNNFSAEEKTAGYVLLDMLLFHNQAQERQLVGTLIRKLQSEIYKQHFPRQDQTSKEINGFLVKELESACYIPVIDEDPVASSNAWSSVVYDCTRAKNCFFSPDKLPLLISLRKKYIIFYDDLLGTGTQFCSFIKKKRFALQDNKSVSIEDIMIKNSDIYFFYICLAGYVEGIKKVENSWDNLRLIVGEKFDETDSILSPENEYWRYYDNEQRDYLINMFLKKTKAIKCSERFTRNLSIMFERNRPSNTISPLYWCDNNDWKPLKARG